MNKDSSEDEVILETSSSAETKANLANLPKTKSLQLATVRAPRPSWLSWWCPSTETADENCVGFTSTVKQISDFFSIWFYHQTTPDSHQQLGVAKHLVKQEHIFAKKDVHSGKFVTEGPSGISQRGRIQVSTQWWNYVWRSVSICCPAVRSSINLRFSWHIYHAGENKLKNNFPKTTVTAMQHW